MKTQFRKYNSIENSYRDKYISRWLRNYPQLINAKFIATEKIHGANFCVNFDKDNNGQIWISFSKRTSVLEKDELFFDCTNVFKQNKESNLIKKIAEYIECNNDINSLKVYGELFGKGVQKFDYEKINSDTGKRFIVFDMVENDRNVSPKNVIETLNKLGLIDMYVPIREKEISLQEVLDIDIDFVSKFSSDECGYPAEGVVIRVYDEFIGYIDEETGKDMEFILKKKNEFLADKKQNRKQKEKVTYGSKFIELKAIVNSYTTIGRLESVFSKHGNIESPRDISKYIKLVQEDVKEDFFKDYFDDFTSLKDDEKKVMFSDIGRRVALMCKSYL